MKKLSTILSMIFVFAMADSHAQFIVDWAENYQHTGTNNFSNEGKKIVTDSLNGYIFMLSDVTSDMNLAGVVTGSTYSYTVLSKWDANANNLGEVVIDVIDHSTTGFDKKSAFGLEMGPAGSVYIGYMNYNASTNSDVNIAKYSNNLVLQWVNKYNAVTDDKGLAMKVTTSGTAFAIVTSNTGSVVRSRVIKASTGATSAVAFYTFNSQADYLNSLTVDAGQNVYVTGYRLLGAYKSIMTASLSPAGILRWQRADNCGTVSGDDIGKHISLGFDGNLYITGSSIGTVQHGNDVVIFKINPTSGKKVWESFINYNLNDGGSFVLNPEPNFVYVSWTAGNAVFVDQLFASDGVLRRRVNYNPIPVSAFSSLNGASIADMQISKHKGIYLTGSINGISAGQSFTASYMIKASFFARGIAAVQYSIPVTGDPSNSFRAVAIALDEDNNRVFLLEDGFESYATHSQENVWLVSFDPQSILRTSADDPIQAGQFMVNVLPNPISDIATFNADVTFNKINICDMNGRIIQEYSGINSNQFEADLSQLTPGMYFARVFGDLGYEGFQKIIKK